jgi:hypothetical protein
MPPSDNSNPNVQSRPLDAFQFCTHEFPASECLMTEILIDRVIQEIDSLAGMLMGSREHFWLKSPSASFAQTKSEQ